MNAGPKGGDPNLSSVERTILIGGSRRDSDVTTPDLDPTPESDIGETYQAKVWREESVESAEDEIEEVLGEIASRVPEDYWEGTLHHKKDPRA